MSVKPAKRAVRRIHRKGAFGFQAIVPVLLGKIGDIPRGTLQLNDVQSRIGPVSKIDEPTVIDLHIVGLDCSFPISWDRFLGCYGNVKSDLLGVGRISHG